jgi:hypothetical protein
MNQELTDIATEVLEELEKATLKHGPMKSAHEGYAVIKEEVDELWDAVKKDDTEHAKREAVQVAAMAMRFLLDV